MTTTTIRDIPDQVYEKVKQRAIANKRSVNSEIVLILEQAVESQSFSSSDQLARIRQFRAKTVGRERLSDQEISDAKNEGRS